MGNNAVLVEFWNQFAPLTLPGGTLYDDAAAAVNNVRAVVDELLQKKIAAPLDVIACPPEFDAALAAYNRFNGGDGVQRRSGKNKPADHTIKSAGPDR